MAVKDITDYQVCEAALYAERSSYRVMTLDRLVNVTNQPVRVCERAIERAERHGLVDWGTSVRGAFLTAEGEELLGLPQAARRWK